VFRPAGGIGAMYCKFINKKFGKYFQVKEARAAEVPAFRPSRQATAQDTVKRDTSAKKDSVAKKDTAAKRDTNAMAKLGD
jgi:hypothetical protein